MIDLSDSPVVDNHVHPWRATSRTLTVGELAGSVAFSETARTSVRTPFLPPDELDPALARARATNLGVRYFLRELARFLGVAEDWEVVTAARNRAAEQDYRGWTARLFGDAGIDVLLVDEGGSRPRVTLDELGRSHRLGCAGWRAPTTSSATSSRTAIRGRASWLATMRAWTRRSPMARSPSSR